MDIDQEVIIYLKDRSFVPDIIILHPHNTIVTFYNSDGCDYTIQCKGIREISDKRIRSGQTIQVTFPVRGRFEISCSEYGLMKCMVEVEEMSSEEANDESGCDEWGNLTYHLSKPKVCKASLTELFETSNIGELARSLESYSHRDAKHMLDMQRRAWGSENIRRQAMGLESNSDDSFESEEFGDFSYQRKMIRNKRFTPPSGTCPSDAAKANSVVGRPGRISPEILSSSSSDSSVAQTGSEEGTPASVSTESEPPLMRLTGRLREVVEIRDYDFNRRNVLVSAGCPVEFRLHNDVPVHVEHVLEGRSTTVDLCFTSPILQHPFSRRFQFLPRVTGEVYVTCQIYPDMGCRLVVLPPLPPPTVGLSGWGSEGMRRRAPTHSSGATTLTRLTGSFPLNPSSAVTPLAPPRPQPFSPAPSPGRRQHNQQAAMLTAVNCYVGVMERSIMGRISSPSVGDISDTVSSSFMDSDDGIEDYDCSPAPPVEESVSISVLGGDGYGDNTYIHPSSPYVSSLTGHVDTATAEEEVDAVVLVQDFQFLPCNINLHVGARVRFQSVSHASMHKLSCAGEFEGVPLECASSSEYIHTFRHAGAFTVKNEIFSFMACDVTISEHDVYSALTEEEENGPMQATTLCEISHSEIPPQQERERGMSEDVLKYYDHIDGRSARTGCAKENMQPIQLLGSFPDLCLHSPEKNGSIVHSVYSSPPSSQKQFIMASADWEFEYDEFSDEEENEEGEQTTSDVMTLPTRSHEPEDSSERVGPPPLPTVEQHSQSSAKTKKRKKARKKKKKKHKVTSVESEFDPHGGPEVSESKSMNTMGVSVIDDGNGDRTKHQGDLCGLDSTKTRDEINEEVDDQATSQDQKLGMVPCDRSERSDCSRDSTENGDCIVDCQGVDIGSSEFANSTAECMTEVVTLCEPGIPDSWPEEISQESENTLSTGDITVLEKHHHSGSIGNDRGVYCENMESFTSSVTKSTESGPSLCSPKTPPFNDHGEMKSDVERPPSRKDVDRNSMESKGVPGSPTSIKPNRLMSLLQTASASLSASKAHREKSTQHTNSNGGGKIVSQDTSEKKNENKERGNSPFRSESRKKQRKKSSKSRSGTHMPCGQLISPRQREAEANVEQFFVESISVICTATCFDALCRVEVTVHQLI